MYNIGGMDTFPLLVGVWMVGVGVWMVIDDEDKRPRFIVGSILVVLGVCLILSGVV